MNKLTLILATACILMISFSGYAQQPLYGDVNGDGEVNISDVNAVIDVILGGHSHHYDYVDLGLPSGTMWATHNVGASSPDEFGDYFAWGETEPKEQYDCENYKWIHGSYYLSLTKYCTNSVYGYNDFVDNKTELDLEDDAAYVNWGPAWRMPSYDQIDELITTCTWTWTTRNGVNGELVTGPNGNTVFFPASGLRNASSSSVMYSGVKGRFWSRTVNSDAPNIAYIIDFNADDMWTNGEVRDYGLTVRAVRNK